MELCLYVRMPLDIASHASFPMNLGASGWMSRVWILFTFPPSLPDPQRKSSFWNVYPAPALGQLPVEEALPTSSPGTRLLFQSPFSPPSVIWGYSPTACFCQLWSSEHFSNRCQSLKNAYTLWTTAIPLKIYEGNNEGYWPKVYLQWYSSNISQNREK